MKKWFRAVLLKLLLGIIETFISDHELVFWAIKSKTEKPDKHNYLAVHSMKNFSTRIYKKALGKLKFPDYENFSSVNETYSDLTLKIFDVVNKATPTKTIRIKNITNGWFDGETAEKNYPPRQIV